MNRNEKLLDLIDQTLSYMKATHRPHERVEATLPSQHIPKKLAPKPPENPIAPPLPSPPPQQKPLVVEEIPTKPPLHQEQALPPPSAPLLPPSDALLKTLQELAPHLLASGPLPEDSLAKQKRFAWKEKGLCADITLLSFEAQTPRHRFLENLARALTLRVCPAKVALVPLLEEENRWKSLLEASSLKQFISFPIPLDAFPHLRALYRANPQSGHQFIGTTPLMILPPYTDYQANPALKRDLWETLCSQQWS